MKKILVVTALIAASIMPVTPVAAATMSKAMAKAEAIPAYCYLLPLLPKCVEAWKAEMDAMKSDMKK
jgi:hypothetical protein